MYIPIVDLISILFALVCQLLRLSTFNYLPRNVVYKEMPLGPSSYRIMGVRSLMLKFSVLSTLTSLLHVCHDRMVTCAFEGDMFMRELVADSTASSFWGVFILLIRYNSTNIFKYEVYACIAISGDTRRIDSPRARASSRAASSSSRC